MKPGDRVHHFDHQWKVVRVWETNTEGPRADLSREDSTKERGVDRCSAQVKDLLAVEKQPSK